MEFIKFEQQQIILAENQPEYTPLPVNINPDANGCPYSACLQFSPAELQQIAENDGKLFITQLTNGNLFAPIRVSIDLPHDISVLSKEELIVRIIQIEALREKEKEQSKEVPNSFDEGIADIENKFTDKNGPQEPNLN